MQTKVLIGDRCISPKRKRSLVLAGLAEFKNIDIVSHERVFLHCHIILLDGLDLGEAHFSELCGSVNVHVLYWLEASEDSLLSHSTTLHTQQLLWVTAVPGERGYPPDLFSFYQSSCILTTIVAVLPLVLAGILDNWPQSGIHVGKCRIEDVSNLCCTAIRATEGPFVEAVGSLRPRWEQWRSSLWLPRKSSSFEERKSCTELNPMPRTRKRGASFRSTQLV